MNPLGDEKERHTVRRLHSVMAAQAAVAVVATDYRLINEGRFT